MLVKFALQFKKLEDAVAAVIEFLGKYAVLRPTCFLIHESTSIACCKHPSPIQVYNRLSVRT